MNDWRLRGICSQTSYMQSGQAFAMWALFCNASGFEQVSTMAVNEVTVTRPRSKTTFAQISPAMPTHSNLDSASRCNLLTSTWQKIAL
jgi:hypothetical protein